MRVWKCKMIWFSQKSCHTSNHHHLLKSFLGSECIQSILPACSSVNRAYFVLADDIFHHLWYVFHNYEFNIFYWRYHAELMPQFENLLNGLKKGSMMHENNGNNNNFFNSEGHANKKQCQYKMWICIYSKYVNLLFS